MDMKLAENIRTFRKQRSLTQEQLAEVLGVTVGAVYKWEAKLSVPDLRLIMEMADFFDTSVDVLLGYEMKDNRQAATIQRLKKYLNDKDYIGVAGGIEEAEKALKKYPNSFEIVYTCAFMYQVSGLEQADKGKLRRALELFEHSRLLLDQNSDPTVSELTIYGHMAEIYISINENEQAVDLLKKNNSCGIYNDLIGLTLASSCKRPDEALPFLSEALLRGVVSTVRSVMGYLNVFFEKKDFEAAREILVWSMTVLDGLRQDGRPSFIDKLETVFYVCLAYTQMKSNGTESNRIVSNRMKSNRIVSCDMEQAKSTLWKARKMAKDFDAAPDYQGNSIRFADYGKQASVHDDLGETAMEGIWKTVSSIGDDTLLELWKEINDHEE